MAKLNLKNIVWKEGKNYVSLNLNTGVSSFGESKKEALAMLQEALELYFEDVSPLKAQRIEKLDFVPSVLVHA